VRSGAFFGDGGPPGARPPTPAPRSPKARDRGHPAEFSVVSFQLSALTDRIAPRSPKARDPSAGSGQARQISGNRHSRHRLRLPRQNGRRHASWRERSPSENLGVRLLGREAGNPANPCPPPCGQHRASPEYFAACSPRFPRFLSPGSLPSALVRNHPFEDFYRDVCEPIYRVRQILQTFRHPVEFG